VAVALGVVLQASVSLGVTPKAYTENVRAEDAVPAVSFEASVQGMPPIHAGGPQEPSHLDLYVLQEPSKQAQAPSASIEPEPVATVAAASVGVEQWRSLVASIFPADTVDNVLRVMQCESGGNPNAVSPTGDHGLMQINEVNFARFAGRSPYDPEANLEVAYAMSAGGTSFWAWSCKP